MSASPAESDLAEQLRRRATRWFSPIGGRTAAVALADLPAVPEVDLYGQGGVVADLETEVAAVVGHEAALLFPTGTMAQQVALRLHADDSGCRTVAMHPLSHPLLHEGDALIRMQGLDVRALGDRRPGRPRFRRRGARPVAGGPCASCTCAPIWSTSIRRFSQPPRNTACGRGATSAPPTVRVGGWSSCTPAPT